MNPQTVNTAIAAGIYLAAVATAWRYRGYIDPAEVAISLAFIWLIIDRLHANERDENTRADVDQLGAELDDVKLEAADIREAVEHVIAYLNGIAAAEPDDTQPITTEPMELADELAADAQAHIVQQRDQVPTVERAIGGHTFRFKETA